MGRQGPAYHAAKVPAEAAAKRLWVKQIRSGIGHSATMRRTLTEPAPVAVFEGYTQTATEYSLRAFLGNISSGVKVQSDLRVAVFEALRARQIELAAPAAAAVVKPAAE